MERLFESFVGTYGGVHDLSKDQVRTHTSNRIDASFSHFRAKVGGHVVRFHHMFNEGAWCICYVCRD